MHANWEKAIDQAVDATFEQMVAVRRHLHAHPEPSGREYETARYLAARLESLGLAVRLAADERGLMVDSPGPESKRRIAR